jgi:GNAT superfamily N-acetyltransferase
VASSIPAGIEVRHDLRRGDLGMVVSQHGVLYGREYGFDVGFEAYVAETAAEFGRSFNLERDRLWIAELDGRMVGSIAILGREDGVAQLRWFLLDPSVRGRGLGRYLVDEALAFCRAAGYRAVYLWTATGLDAAAHLYLAAGFRKTETKPPATIWGAEVSEERYDLTL